MHGAGTGHPLSPGLGRVRTRWKTGAATCCWIFPSSVTTQCVVAQAPRAATLSKAESLRSQPGPEQVSSLHRPRIPTAAAAILAPPTRSLTPEPEATPRCPPSWGGLRGRRWTRRRRSLEGRLGRLFGVCVVKAKGL